MFDKIKLFLLKKFVLLQDLKDTKKEIQDVNHVLGLLMDHYWDIEASKALPAKGIKREQQLKEYEIMHEISVALDAENIPYWLDYGTLLGSVRHKGFVPWDDDVDLGALREDRERIINTLKLKYPNKYQFGDFGKIDSFLKVELFEGDRYTFVDIYFYNKENDRLFTRVFELTKSYNTPFPYDIIFPLKKGVFEGREYNIPNNAHLYLKKNYGDYMTVPKKSHAYPHKGWDAHEVFYKD